MLRRYRSLRSGFGVLSRPTVYEPFRLTLTFREAPKEACNSTEEELISSTPNSPSMLLVISAIPVKSAFKGKQIHFLLYNIYFILHKTQNFLKRRKDFIVS